MQCQFVRVETYLSIQFFHFFVDSLTFILIFVNPYIDSMVIIPYSDMLIVILSLINSQTQAQK